MRAIIEVHVQLTEVAACPYSNHKIANMFSEWCSIESCSIIIPWMQVSLKREKEANFLNGVQMYNWYVSLVHWLSILHEHLNYQLTYCHGCSTDSKSVGLCMCNRRSYILKQAWQRCGKYLSGDRILVGHDK